MTQKSCAVGMRNAKLGNHLKLIILEIRVVQCVVDLFLFFFFNLLLGPLQD